MLKSDDQQSPKNDREVIEWLDPDTILLDKSNPRISPILLADGLASPTQEQIGAAIVKSREWRSGRGGFTTPFNDFLNAVIKDGRINEPPVVQRQRDGKPVVLHGNNRVLAAQRAKKQVPGEGFDSIRCRVLPADTPEAEIQKYMRIAHNPTTKQADWHPAVHAHMLYQFANADIGGIGTMTSRELQEEFTKGPKTIKDMVQAYGAMQQYMSGSGDRRPLALWATFHEIYRNKGVAELYTNDDDFRDGVHKSVQEKKLNAEDVKILPKIKEDEEAWKELTVGAGSATAKMMVEGDVESDNHFDRMRKLSRIIDDVSSGPRARGIKRNPAQKKIVTDLVESVRTLLEKADMEDLLEVETA
jgi:hypothetical protein